MSNSTRNAQCGIPVAYFITVHTYGTWLPGDARGWVDHHRPHHGQERPAPSARLAALAAGSQRRAPLILDAAMRRITAAAIRDTCEDADWTLIALDVRSNHIHALVASDASAGQTLSRLKGAATRRLRASGAVQGDRPVWSKQGSTRYLWRADSVTRVRYYIEAMQDDLSLVMPWTDGG